MGDCVAQISRTALMENIESIKNSCNNKKIIATVKANAYGHGSIEMVCRLKELGITSFSVARFDEAMSIVSSNILDNEDTILILSPIPNEHIREAIINNITLTVSNFEYALLVDKVSRELRRKAKVHILIDTGMGRIGFNCRHLGSISSTVRLLKCISVFNMDIDGIFTHFATADEDSLFLQKQYDLFKASVQKCSELDLVFRNIHCCNSGAILNLQDDICNCIRPGIIMYGYYPSNFIVNKSIQVKPIMSLYASVTHIKSISKGTSISYGRNYTAKKDTIIATISMGYADGLRRDYGKKGKLVYKNSFVDIAGNICMDQTMLVVDSSFNLCLGDKVFLICNINNAEHIANKVGTISYEVLTSITSRVKRVWVN